MIAIYVAATALLLLLIASHLHKRTGRIRPLIGSYGTVESDLDPEGIVLIQGEAFLARAETASIPADTQIVAIRMEGSILIVRAA